MEYGAMLAELSQIFTGPALAGILYIAHKIDKRIYALELKIERIENVEIRKLQRSLNGISIDERV